MQLPVSFADLVRFHFLPLHFHNLLHIGELLSTLLLECCKVPLTDEIEIRRCMVLLMLPYAKSWLKPFAQGV